MCYKPVINGRSNSVFYKKCKYNITAFKYSKVRGSYKYSSLLKISERYINKTYAVDDFVRCGNIKDLLYIRDYKCTKLELNEINCLLKVLCTD